MDNAYLLRYKQSDQGTLGIFFSGTFVLHTLELPYRDNKHNLSRIPQGDYTCKAVRTSKYGIVYQVMDVFMRSGILIHNGNFAGDVTLGFKTNSQGCILIGEKVGTISGQIAVLNSRIARNEFEKYFDYRPFTLTIKNEG